MNKKKTINLFLIFALVLALSGNLKTNDCDDMLPKDVEKAEIINGILKKDVVCKSPSTAGWGVLGMRNNGCMSWKNANGDPIDVYRK